MEKKWKQDNRIFETLWEAEMWSDSIANEMYGKLYETYVTPDHKVAYVLAFHLASNPEIHVKTEMFTAEGSFLYKVSIK
ncbi:hypothetical protein J9317_04995 [Metabacillus sp. KIGAM252]|uniref:Uncharacterized protein n=1 Tax=Metabacillus flavus TaxID=2823519 RepID=A0ABS5LBL0_9BACI|nr:hypothetical protein [Metabacillus flavus]MBS2968111.1 hypothetical protein [Metabacillus flavus]